MYPKPLTLCYLYFFPTSFTKLFSSLLYKHIPVSSHSLCPRYCISNWVRKLIFMGPFMCPMHLWLLVNKTNKNNK